MVNEKDIKMAAHSIYFKNADIPKETVIARGKVELLTEETNSGPICTGAILICRDKTIGLNDILNMAEAGSLDGKTIEIIIREVDND